MKNLILGVVIAALVATVSIFAVNERYLTLPETELTNEEIKDPLVALGSNKGKTLKSF